LNVPEPSPPVPTTSTTSVPASTRVDASRMTSARPAISSGVSPFMRKAMAKPALGRPKSFVFQYRPPTKSFALRLQFKKHDVDRTEVIAALEAIIADLRKRQD